MVTRPVADNQPLVALCFQDDLRSLCRAYFVLQGFSGVVRNDATLQNYNRNAVERFSHLAIMEGKVATSVSELHAGTSARSPS
jgi:elongation factor G